MIDTTGDMTDYYREKAGVCCIPPYMLDGIIRWTVHHIPPGEFLCAVIKNDLREAVGRADSANRHLLYNYVNFFYNYTPSQCWGSPEKFENWRRKE